jgi:hypothetical protein
MGFEPQQQGMQPLARDTQLSSQTRYGFAPGEVAQQ